MRGAVSAETCVFADPETLAQAAAEWLVHAAAAKPGRFAVALSGGATPRRLYEILAEPACSGRLAWERLHWFWGDERWVARDDPRSNRRMAEEALLSRAPVPRQNIHAIATGGADPAASARAYEQELKHFYGAERLDPSRPLFDVVLLGLGEDGHTASLFPDSPNLQERVRWTAVAHPAGLEARITLTYPALESTAAAAFLVSGRGKQAILRRFLRGDHSLPAVHLKPQGALKVFADRAAAG